MDWFNSGMETIEKSPKRKRKRGELDKSEVGSTSSKGDHDLHHRNKRLHQSSSADPEHEEMLDTVSGHIRELEIKEEDMDGDDSRTSKQTKAGTKSKKMKKKQTGSLKLDENGEGTKLGDDLRSAAQMESRTVTDISSSGVSQESALEYLRQWKEERERWSFKKKTQYWLLQNMYDRTKVGNCTVTVPVALLM